MRVIIVDEERFALVTENAKIKGSMPVGAELKNFWSPVKALRYAENNMVDVAFLCMEMTQMHGLILASKLKKLNPRINLIFVSLTGDYLDHAWRMHASDYLCKPIKRERVASSLKNLRYAGID